MVVNAKKAAQSTFDVVPICGEISSETTPSSWIRIHEQNKRMRTWIKIQRLRNAVASMKAAANETD